MIAVSARRRRKGLSSGFRSVFVDVVDIKADIEHGFAAANAV